MLSRILWTCYFLLSQGILIKDNVIHQSAILLEHKTKILSGKRTRQIHISERFKSVWYTGIFSSNFVPTSPVSALHLLHIGEDVASYPSSFTLMFDIDLPYYLLTVCHFTIGFGMRSDVEFLIP
jgi:hypothetical protein